MSEMQLRVVGKGILGDGHPAIKPLHGSKLIAGRNPPEGGWILPDPKKKISRRHFSVTKQGAEYWLEDEGSANGVYLNDGETPLNAPHLLSPGDRFRVRSYEIVFEAAQTRPKGGWDARPAVREPEADQPAPATGGPMANIAGGGWAAQAARLRQGRAQSAVPAAKPVFHDKRPIDEGVISTGPTGWPKGRDEEAPSDLEPVEPVAAPEPVQPAPSELAQAFLRGAGLPEALADDCSDPAFFAELGAIINQSVKDLRRLLDDRTETRDVMCPEEATLHGAVRDPNPLKSNRDDAEVIEDLLFGGGSTLASRRVEDAFADLHRHQQAQWYALQPALKFIVAPLDPNVLGAETGFLTGNPWKRYTAVWNEMVAQHDNGMLDVFIQRYGEEYAKADREMKRRSKKA